MAATRMSYKEWWAEGERRFGKDIMLWRFVCPSCGNIAAIADYRAFKEKGATPNSPTSECIGRYTGATDAFDSAQHKPCNYAGYGLIRISPIVVIQEDGQEIESFAFA